jgi:hypothetical protein
MPVPEAGKPASDDVLVSIGETDSKGIYRVISKNAILPKGVSHFMPRLDSSSSAGRPIAAAIFSVGTISRLPSPWWFRSV